jgi:hypothetical protein
MLIARISKEIMDAHMRDCQTHRGITIPCQTASAGNVRVPRQKQAVELNTPNQFPHTWLSLTRLEIWKKKKTTRR